MTTIHLHPHCCPLVPRESLKTNITRRDRWVKEMWYNRVTVSVSCKFLHGWNKKRETAVMLILILAEFYVYQIKTILHSLRNYWERNWLRAPYNVLIFCYIPILVLAENNLYCHIKTILYSLRIYWQSNTLLAA